MPFKIIAQLALFCILLACEHYPSNVEIVYKNSKGQGYKPSGSNLNSKEAIFEEDAPIKKDSRSKGQGIQSFRAPEPQIEELKSVSTPKPAVHITEEPLKKSSEEYHVVQKGETFYSVSRMHQIEINQLKIWNDYKDGDILLPGTIIYLKNPKVHAEERHIVKAEPLTIKKDETKQVSKGNCGEKFLKPTSNASIITKFGEPHAGGVKSDGIIFKVTSEEAVKVASGGEVVYIGDGFSDYGNIVILKHNNNYFSIYGYLKDIRLKKGQQVARGEVVSKTSLKEGKFYFSVRKGKVPINPTSCF